MEILAKSLGWKAFGAVHASVSTVCSEGCNDECHLCVYGSPVNQIIEIFFNNILQSDYFYQKLVNERIRVELINAIPDSSSRLYLANSPLME